MSFSITAVGKPEALKRRLRLESERLSGQSKMEFDAILPSLETLVEQNVGGDCALRLEAYGHATFKDGVKVTGYCTAALTSVGQLAE